MDWTVLGIAPTKDKKTITAAYRARLVQVNPEDKPEEFKQLRAAYEQALEYAAKEEQPAERDESPVGLWMEKIRCPFYGTADLIFFWGNPIFFFKSAVKSRIITKTTRQGGFLHGAALFYFKFGIDKASLDYKVIKADM